MAGGKILIKKPMVLEVNNCILEVSRFNKKEYTVYRLASIDSDGGVQLEVLDSTFGFRRGALVSGSYECFFGHQNTKWLNYYLPTGMVLFG